MTQKPLIKMQISPIKNPNVEKTSRNLSNRTKVKILKKNFFGYLSNKIWFRVCSVTAEMFEHRNSGENRRKRSEFFFSKIYEGHIRIWFRSKKNSKLSHACVPLRYSWLKFGSAWDMDIAVRDTLPLIPNEYHSWFENIALDKIHVL
jgi:hypothetical protein